MVKIFWILFWANIGLLLAVSGAMIWLICFIFLSKRELSEEEKKEILKAVRSQIPRRGKLNAYVEGGFLFWQCPVCGYNNKEKLKVKADKELILVLICRECWTGLVYKHKTGKYRLPGKEWEK